MRRGFTRINLGRQKVIRRAKRPSGVKEIHVANRLFEKRGVGT